MKTEDLLKLAGLGIAAYLLWQLLNKGRQAVSTAAAPLASGAASLWSAFHPGQPGVLGNVILPDGTDAGPLARMRVRQDSTGNVQVLINGVIYQLGQSDINGNWPAQSLLPEDFGLANPGGW